MDLYQIRYFLTIAEVGNFTKAAERLYISQPSLSAGIKKLEKELDVKLFERGGRQVTLTSAGRVFQEKARSILAEYQSARQDLERFKERPTLHVATLHSLRSSSLAEIFGGFRNRYPNVTIEICHGYLQDIQDWLERGIVDLALTWLPDADDTETSQFLFHQAITLAVPKDHPFASLKSIQFTDLDGQPYIERSNCEFLRARPRMFEAVGIQPKIVYSSNNEEWAIALIQAGMGMSIMPVWNDLENLTYVPMTDLSLSRAIGLRWRDRQLEAIDWFRNYVAECDWGVAI